MKMPWLDKDKKLYVSTCRANGQPKHLASWAVPEGKRTKWVLVATWTTGKTSYFVWNNQK